MRDTKQSTVAVTKALTAVVPLLLLLLLVLCVPRRRGLLLESRRKGACFVSPSCPPACNSIGSENTRVHTAHTHTNRPWLCHKKEELDVRLLLFCAYHIIESFRNDAIRYDTAAAAAPSSSSSSSQQQSQALNFGVSTFLLGSGWAEHLPAIFFDRFRLQTPSAWARPGASQPHLRRGVHASPPACLTRLPRHVPCALWRMAGLRPRCYAWLCYVPRARCAAQLKRVL